MFPDIVAALVAAKAEMAPLVTDESAKITSRTGQSFSFKYASLQAILKVVTPVLTKHGVLLVQDVGDHDGMFGVVTRLLLGDDSIDSHTLPVDRSGDMRDLAGKVTTARRIQLIAMLGLVAEEDEGTNQQQQPQQSTPYRQTATITPPLPELQAAARKGREVIGGDLSEELWGLMGRLRDHDSDEAANLATVPSPGKSMSAYSYLVSLVPGGEVTLSFLLGRAITPGTPPKSTHRFLIDDLRAGNFGAAIQEAHALARQ